MCWQCDHPEVTREEYLDLLYDKVVEDGWMSMHIESERTPFSYTIGLHECGLPELLITGVEPPRGQLVLDAVAEYCVGAEAPAPGDVIELPDRRLLEVVEVAQPDAHMGLAVSIFGDGLRALQLVWADDAGRWPWSADFNPGGRRHPVLGRRAGTA